MNRIAVLLALAGTLCLMLREVGADERPNVVFLLVDDLGWTDISCFGSDLYQTPNIDRLASKGMKFTDGYAACTVCSPTRAAAMSGMYPARIHVTDFISGHARPHARLRVPDWTKRLEYRHVTIAEALKSAGYATALLGKWHLAPRDEVVRSKEDRAYFTHAHGFDLQVLCSPATTVGWIWTATPPRTNRYAMARARPTKAESAYPRSSNGPA